MTIFHRPVGLVELLILYARVQFYTPRASDYRLISKTDEVVSSIPAQVRCTRYNIVSDLRQVSGFLWVLWFPPSIKLTATI
jgi:hypothetical protein